MPSRMRRFSDRGNAALQSRRKRTVRTSVTIWCGGIRSIHRRSPVSPAGVRNGIATRSFVSARPVHRWMRGKPSRRICYHWKSNLMAAIFLVCLLSRLFARISHRRVSKCKRRRLHVDHDCKPLRHRRGKSFPGTALLAIQQQVIQMFSLRPAGMLTAIRL